MSQIASRPADGGRTVTTTLNVFSRRGCHLCEVLLEELLPLVRTRACVEVIDVDANAQLAARYGLLVPVVELDGREICRYRLDRGAVERALRAAS